MRGASQLRQAQPKNSRVGAPIISAMQALVRKFLDCAYFNNSRKKQYTPHPTLQTKDN